MSGDNVCKETFRTPTAVLGRACGPPGAEEVEAAGSGSIHPLSHHEKVDHSASIHGFLHREFDPCNPNRNIPEAAFE